MKNPYDILGIPATAPDEAVKEAYKNLSREIMDRYAGTDEYDARMKEINDAYDDILRARAGFSGNTTGAQDTFTAVRSMFAKGQFSEGESALDRVPEADRTAEWHFLKSVCYDRRGRTSDAMTELNIACAMDPANNEYTASREAFSRRAGSYGSAYRADAYGQPRGADDSCARMCNCCSDLIILDCCCECMGGDCIRCI